MMKVKKLWCNLLDKKLLETPIVASGQVIKETIRKVKSYREKSKRKDHLFIYFKKRGLYRIVYFEIYQKQGSTSEVTGVLLFYDILQFCNIHNIC